MTPEDLVLAPRDALLHSDDWPEFELRNVQIYEPNQPDVLVSLLEAAEHHPLMVSGTLQPRYGRASTPLYVGKARSAQIQLSNVVLFAYGELEDGAIAVWAAGKSGWFAISPHPKYQSIYDDMAEAIKILYFVVDAYRKRKKNGSKHSRNLPDISVEELFEAYAQEHENMDVNTAGERIFAHRRFLLATMLAGKEDISWPRNGLFLHLCSKFPNDMADVKERMFGVKSTKLANSRQSSAATSVKSSLSAAKRRRQQSSPLDSSKLKNEVQKPAFQSTKQTRSSRPPQPAEAISGTESDVGASESDSSGTPALLISDEDEAPSKGRKRKSSLRLKPLVGIKGTPRPTRATKMSESDEDTNESPVPQQIANEGKRRPLARNNQSTAAVPEEPEPLEMPDEISSSQIAEQMDPVQEDTWNCARDGCMHKVYFASHEDSRTLIQQHNDLHSYDDDARVKMVQRLQAPSLPVKHLMERVRMRAKADQLPDASHSRSPFPPPVVQKY